MTEKNVINPSSKTSPNQIQDIEITLDSSKTLGIIRNILGMNNSPRINSEANLPTEKEYFKALSPARVRYHDAVYENPGYALIDVTRIFPLFRADEKDPANYDFKPTDLYLKQVVECGTPIEFRLGETIEHAPEQFRVKPPVDIDKWANICVNIVRHYNDGWADGFHWNIQFWSIWEEPGNVPRLFTGDYDVYLKLFVTTFKKIKAAFPNVKVGGTNDALPFSFPKKRIEKSLQYFADEGVRPDFLAYTAYARTPDEYVNDVETVQRIMDEFGYGSETELNLSEFHYAPSPWNLQGYNASEMHDHVSAAFATTTLIRFLDTRLSYAFHYAWQLSCWGLFDKYLKPYPLYYGLKYFTEMSKCAKRLSLDVSGELPHDVCLLAGTLENGNAKLLVSCFKSPKLRFIIKVPEYAACQIKSITSANDDFEASHDLARTEEGFVFTFDTEDSAVFQLEFRK